MMTVLSQTLFDQAKEELRQARELIVAGRYGEAERLAYHASDSIAAGYMARFDDEAEPTTEKQLPQHKANNDNEITVASIDAFERFVKSTQNVGLTPEETQNIEHVIDTVAGLREAHDWSVLDEITEADAELMLQQVQEMLELVAGLLGR
jgi:HEPN domain-containing protein